MAEETAVTVPKKRKLSLSLKENQFKSVTHQEVRELEKKIEPKSIDACTRWTMKIFREWFTDYNNRDTEGKCPDVVLFVQSICGIR